MKNLFRRTSRKPSSGSLKSPPESPPSSPGRKVRFQLVPKVATVERYIKSLDSAKKVARNLENELEKTELGKLDTQELIHLGIIGTALLVSLTTPLGQILSVIAVMSSGLLFGMVCEEKAAPVK